MSKQNNDEHLNIVELLTIKWHYTKWKLNRLIYAFQKCLRPNFAFAHTLKQTLSSSINALHIFYWLCIVAVITIACGYWNEKQHLLGAFVYLFATSDADFIYSNLVQTILFIIDTTHFNPLGFSISISISLDNSHKHSANWWFAICCVFFLLHPIKSIYHWHCKMFVQW